MKIGEIYNRDFPAASNTGRQLYYAIAAIIGWSFLSISVYIYKQGVNPQDKLEFYTARITL